MVTRWADGREMLNEGAARRFAKWGVEPRGHFVPEYEQDDPPTAPPFSAHGLSD